MIDIVPGMAHMVSRIEVMSAPGRRRLMSLPWLRDAESIRRALEAVGELIAEDSNPDRAKAMDAIRLGLMQIKEIKGTAARTLQADRLDDIELFELKSFALTVMELRKALMQTDITAVVMPDLEPVADILDPCRARIPHFYIYDDYSTELAAVRKRIKALNADGSDEATREAEQLFITATELEDGIREDLSRMLHTHADAINEALAQVAQLDVLQALSRLAASEHLTKPMTASEGVHYTGLVNPAVRAALAQKGKTYQPVDITLHPGATVITGANMAGKSVLLKSAALAQAMMQFGMYVPAAEARIAPVDEILLSIGDDQSEMSGLSSYAAEMMRIDTILSRLRSGIRALVLIDEPARTTNPVEGLALVQALTSILSGYDSTTALTTHYSGITVPCHRLRVKGLADIPPGTPLRPGDLNKYIDYSLTEEAGDSVPHEAVRIARLLGIDAELIDKTQSIIEQN